MKIELTQQDCNNIKVSLMVMAKQPNTTESEMGAILNLSQKFNWKEQNAKKETTNDKTQDDGEKEKTEKKT